MNYKETIEMVNDKIKNFELKDLQELNSLSSDLFFAKQPFVLAKEESIEFYTYCAINNLCLCIDECRDNYLEKKLTLTQIEEKIKSRWNEDYSKF